ncbi:MAG: tripartite tricarboxylate transporter substrate binding protein [Comamonadaceae bacterium]|nr:MAG: tripartite tricarboxylate transporter substrate binding protein [Comamonadaceae bacterium]
MNLRRRRLVAAIAAGLAVPAVLAQKLPAGKPVRIVVPYAPGGTTDILARQIGTRLATALGHAVVVENKPGGAGTIAGAMVAAAPADGLTLLLGGVELATAPALVGDRTFLATRDVAAVASLTSGPLVLVVNAQKTQARSLAELLAAARAQPGAFTIASAGNGNVTHLFGEIFKRTAKVDVRHVPYRGAVPALTDLQAGEVTMMMVGTANVRQLVTAGNLRALAVTGQDASVLGLPGVPTFAQAGLPMAETDAGAWTALFAPKAIPRDAVQQINQAVNAVLAQPELRAQLAAIGLAAEPAAPEAVQALLAAQTRVWTELTAQSGIKVE